MGGPDIIFIGVGLVAPVPTTFFVEDNDTRQTDTESSECGVVHGHYCESQPFLPIHSHPRRVTSICGECDVVERTVDG